MANKCPATRKYEMYKQPVTVQCFKTEGHGDDGIDTVHEGPLEVNGNYQGTVVW